MVSIDVTDGLVNPYDTASGAVPARRGSAPGVLYPTGAYPSGDRKTTHTSQTPIGLTYLPPKDSTIRLMQSQDRGQERRTHPVPDRPQRGRRSQRRAPGTA